MSIVKSAKITGFASSTRPLTISRSAAERFILKNINHSETLRQERPLKLRMLHEIATLSLNHVAEALTEAPLNLSAEDAHKIAPAILGIPFEPGQSFTEALTPIVNLLLVPSEEQSESKKRPAPSEPIEFTFHKAVQRPEALFLPVISPEVVGMHYVTTQLMKVFDQKPADLQSLQQFMSQPENLTFLLHSFTNEQLRKAGERLEAQEGVTFAVESLGKPGSEKELDFFKALLRHLDGPLLNKPSPLMESQAKPHSAEATQKAIHACIVSLLGGTPDFGANDAASAARFLAESRSRFRERLTDMHEGTPDENKRLRQIAGYMHHARLQAGENPRAVSVGNVFYADINLPQREAHIENPDPILYARIVQAETSLQTGKPAGLVEAWEQAPACRHKPANVTQQNRLRTVLTTIETCNLPLYTLGELQAATGLDQNWLFNTLMAGPHSPDKSLWMVDRVKGTATPTPNHQKLLDSLGLLAGELVAAPAVVKLDATQIVNPKSFVVPAIVAAEPRHGNHTHSELITLALAKIPAAHAKAVDARRVLENALTGRLKPLTGENKNYLSLPHVWLMWAAQPATERQNFEAMRESYRRYWNLSKIASTRTLDQELAWSAIAAMRNTGRFYPDYNSFLADVTKPKMEAPEFKFVSVELASAMSGRKVEPKVATWLRTGVEAPISTIFGGSRRAEQLIGQLHA